MKQDPFTVDFTAELRAAEVAERKTGDSAGSRLARVVRLGSCRGGAGRFGPRHV